MHGFLRDNSLHMRRDLMDLSIRIDYTTRRALVYKERKDRYKGLYRSVVVDLERRVQDLERELEKANVEIDRKENEVRVQATLASGQNECIDHLEAKKKALQDDLEKVNEKVTDVNGKLKRCKLKLLERGKLLKESERARAELSIKLEESEHGAIARMHAKVIKGIKHFMRSSVFEVVSALSSYTQIQEAFERAYHQLNHIGAIHEDANVDDIGLNKDSEMRPILNQEGVTEPGADDLSSHEFRFTLDELNTILAAKGASHLAGDGVPPSENAQCERDRDKEAQGEHDRDKEAREELAVNDEVVVDAIGEAGVVLECFEGNNGDAESFIGDIIDHIVVS